MKAMNQPVDKFKQFLWRAGRNLLSTTSIGRRWLFYSHVLATRFGRIERDLNLAILVAMGIIGSVAHTMTQSRARLAGRYRTIAVIIIMAGGIVVAASIGIAIWWRRDAVALILPMVLGYLLTVLWLGMPSITGLLKPSGLPPNAGVALAKTGIAGVVTAPMYWLPSSSDRWFLQPYHGAAAVGVYSVGYSNEEL
jgi:hypothetical protein